MVDQDLTDWLFVDERRTLESLLNRLFPSDELGPGASALEVPAHLQRRLNAGSPAQRLAYYAGVRTLQRVARERAGVSFSELSDREADLVIRQLDRADVDCGLAADGELRMTGEQFVNLVTGHLYDAILSDPAHGANPEGTGWGLVGYPGPRAVVSELQQAIDGDWQPTSRSIYADERFSRWSLDSELDRPGNVTPSGPPASEP